MRAWPFILCLLCFYPLGFAAKISIQTNPDDPNSQLEIRSLTLPDGSESEYYVIRSSPVVITIDDEQTLVADAIEIDLSNNLVRIIGFGTFNSGQETIQGYDLSVELEDETFRGRDVLITTEAIDVIGVDASRVPGQIDVVQGRFSPCSRCDQKTQDYGFRAKRLELYPGDRLVGFDVTVLIRGASVFFLPLLVVPLAPPDRQPRLSIQQGSESERAEIALDWPYVSGSSALGTFSLRYYSDITPGEGNLFSRAILGGRADQHYFGGGLSHRFFTETGKGNFDFFYTPAFITYAGSEATGMTQDAFRLNFRYDTEQELDIPQISFDISRNDESKQRIVEYTTSYTYALQGLKASYKSQGFFDLDPNDETRTPSYGSPLRTFSQLELSPEQEQFGIGPFTISGLRLDLGFFEDQSNPSNRSAAASPEIRGLRLLEGHSITLEEIRPWSGLSLSGNTQFTGRYYTSSSGIERLIDWETRLDLLQNLGIGSFSLAFLRDINEGETPFLFDTIGLGNTENMTGNVNLEPAPWLSLGFSGGYTFVDDRRPNATGLDPFSSSIEFFNNLNGISLSVDNTFDVRESDPGNLRTSLNLQASSDILDASLSASYTDDLKPINDRGERENTSESNISANYGLRPYFNARLNSGYTFEPAPAAAGEATPFWQPLELGLDLGTEEALVSGSIDYVRDQNEKEVDSLGFSARTSFAFITANLSQTFDFEASRDNPNNVPWNSNLSLTWQGLATLEWSGPAFIPPGLVGIEISDTAQESWSFNLLDELENSSIDWRLAYSFTKDPSLNDNAGGLRNHQLESFVNIDSERIAGLSFGVDFNANLHLADSEKISFLDTLSLSLFADIYSTVGLKGNFSYDGNADLEQVTSSTLSIDTFSLTVKLFDQLYLASVFNDVWDFTGNNSSQSPYNFQPEFRLIWDRCCWALYSSWDSQTGAFSITLTTPGNTETGLAQNFETGLTLPGRGGENSP